jgi:hypothetical protein
MLISIKNKVLVFKKFRSHSIRVLFLFEGGKTARQSGYSLGLQLHRGGTRASATATASHCLLPDCHSTLYNKSLSHSDSITLSAARLSQHALQQEPQPQRQHHTVRCQTVTARFNNTETAARHMSVNHVTLLRIKWL